jgi:hypothetical protein
MASNWKVFQVDPPLNCKHLNWVLQIVQITLIRYPDKFHSLERQVQSSGPEITNLLPPAANLYEDTVLLHAALPPESCLLDYHEKEYSPEENTTWLNLEGQIAGHVYEGVTK